MAFEYNVRSVMGTHFTTEIAQNAGEDESISLPACLAGINGNARGAVRSISIVSDENLAWEVQFWRSATHGATVDAFKWIGRSTFAASDAVRLAGAGSYLYYIAGLDIPYVDADNSGKLHVTLTNRSAASKTAGAGGEVVLDVRMQPIGFD